MNAGQSIAVQNFNENVAILALSAGYAMALQVRLALDTVLLMLGILIVFVTAALRAAAKVRTER
jgi:LPLT family lysophospholipid transporter-like MFS transporter